MRRGGTEEGPREKGRSVQTELEEDEEEEVVERRGRVRGVSCGGAELEGRRDWREMGWEAGSSINAGIVVVCVLAFRL